MSDRDLASGIDHHAIAAELFSLLGTGRQISSLTARYPELSLTDGYRIAELVRLLREERGERPVGRKIGFTNRAAWENFSVTAPIWGYMFDQTVHDLTSNDVTFSLTGLAEPRLEPELILALASVPSPGMDELAMLGCLAWVAHGFEIVQSVFHDWSFTAADAIAAFGVHGALLVGPRHRVEGDEERWFRSLSSFEVHLERNDEGMAKGHAQDLLGGPLTALRHLVDLLARDDTSPSLAQGEIITTGTLTTAFPATAGETWSTRLTGVALEGLRVRMT